VPEPSANPRSGQFIPSPAVRLPSSYLPPALVQLRLTTDQTFPTRGQVGFCSAGSCSLVLRGLDGHSRNLLLPFHACLSPERSLRSHIRQALHGYQVSSRLVLSQETPPISCGAVSDTLIKSESAFRPFAGPKPPAAVKGTIAFPADTPRRRSP